MNQTQLIPTPKTMLDWFAENHVDHISMDVKAVDGADIIAVYAQISRDEATGRGVHEYFAVNEDGRTCVGDEYGDSISASDAVTFAVYVKQIEQLLAKPHPQNDSRWIIWSIEHGSWWGPNHRGYVGQIEQAGVYSYHEALEIVGGANKHNIGGTSNLPNEAMIEVTEDIAKRLENA